MLMPYHVLHKQTFWDLLIFWLTGDELTKLQLLGNRMLSALLASLKVSYTGPWLPMLYQYQLTSFDNIDYPSTLYNLLRLPNCVTTLAIKLVIPPRSPPPTPGNSLFPMMVGSGRLAECSRNFPRCLTTLTLMYQWHMDWDVFLANLPVTLAHVTLQCHMAVNDVLRTSVTADLPGLITLHLHNIKPGTRALTAIFPTVEQISMISVNYDYDFSDDGDQPLLEGLASICSPNSSINILSLPRTITDLNISNMTLTDQHMACLPPRLTQLTCQVQDDNLSALSKYPLQSLRLTMRGRGRCSTFSGGDRPLSLPLLHTLDLFGFDIVHVPSSVRRLTCNTEITYHASNNSFELFSPLTMPIWQTLSTCNFSQLRDVVIFINTIEDLELLLVLPTTLRQLTCVCNTYVGSIDVARFIQLTGISLKMNWEEQLPNYTIGLQLPSSLTSLYCSTTNFKDTTYNIQGTIPHTLSSLILSGQIKLLDPMFNLSKCYQLRELHYPYIHLDGSFDKNKTAGIAILQYIGRLINSLPLMLRTVTIFVYTDNYYVHSINLTQHVTEMLYQSHFTSRLVTLTVRTR